jgi:chromosome segregation ATPase
VKIRKSIDEMVATLKIEQADEVKAKDNCVVEIRENEKAIALKQRAITELTAFIEESEATLKTLAKEIVEHKADVKETQKQMASASEEREAENKEFQDAVKEQRAAQDVLKKAKARLEAFYKKKAGLLQAKPNDLVQAVLGGHFVLYQGGQTPGAALSEKPKGFETYETKSKGMNGVLALLSSIIQEAHTMEKEGLAAETDAQASYEDFIKGSNDSVSKLAALIAEKTQQMAELTADKETAKADRSAALEDADRLITTGVDLHKSCDFLVKNFEVRQAGRQQEMDALAEAKAVFSGADFA